MLTVTSTKFLEKIIGGLWTGVKFHFRDVACSDATVLPAARLCEGVAESFGEPVCQPVERVSCCGARRSLALNDVDDKLIEHIVTESGIDRSFATRVVKRTPHLTTPPMAISYGLLDSPDVVIGYIRPDSAMKLVRQWQQVHGTSPLVRLSSFMAICGDVIVGAYVTNRLRVSFGCRDSREFGGVEDDRVVVGIPYGLLEPLLETDLQATVAGQVGRTPQGRHRKAFYENRALDTI